LERLPPKAPRSDQIRPDYRTHAPVLGHPVLAHSPQKIRIEIFTFKKEKKTQRTSISFLKAGLFKS
jgi:hypothetical protein